MKNTITIITLLLFSMLLNGQTAVKVEKKQDTVTFIVNMHCNACKEKIEKSIPMERGIKDLDVNLEKKEVKIIYNPKKTNPQKIADAIKELGYTATEKNKKATVKDGV